tara:strand:+ start:22329 stop:23276 length:948 start_codon:yes stop_codon:yes gene_type:complete
MLVSIVTPVYNCEKYIEETIESVLAQDYQDIEYIIIDDGSIDSTPSILEKYQDRVEIVRQKNSGEQSAVNYGVRLALGSVVGVVNADDPVKPTLVSRAIVELSSDPELVGVYPDWEKIDAHGDIVSTVRVADFSLSDMLEQCFCIPGPGTLFRKSALRGEPARRSEFKYSGDFDLWLRLSLQGKMKRIPEVLATWRMHPESASYAYRDPEMAANKVNLFKKFFNNPSLPEELYQLRRQALSSAFYAASILGVFNKDIPAKGYLMRSFLLRPIWPSTFRVSQKRSWIHVLLVLTSPLSTHVLGWFNRAYNSQSKRR